jgi:hypothetical protein
MFVNFRARGISRGAHKLTWTKKIFHMNALVEVRVIYVNFLLDREVSLRIYGVR